MWREEHLWNVSALQVVHVSDLVKYYLRKLRASKGYVSPNMFMDSAPNTESQTDDMIYLSISLFILRCKEGYNWCRRSLLALNLV
jgi:hypothetical protein